MSKPDTSAEIRENLRHAFDVCPKENDCALDERRLDDAMQLITSYTKQRELALLDRLEEAIGNNLPIGDEIADNRSYTGERIHNKIKDELRQVIIKEKEKLL